MEMVMKNRNGNIDAWDRLFSRAMENREDSSVPLTLEQMVVIIDNKKPIPKDIDLGTFEVLNTFRDVEAELELPKANDKKSSPIEYLSFIIGKGIDYVASSFQIEQLQLAPTRSDEVGEVFKGTTDLGTSFQIEQNISRDNVLTLSWGDYIKSRRITIRREGKLLESLPVEEVDISLKLNNPGSYIIERKENHEIVEQFSISLKDMN
jgi:hypothetical protein